MLKILKTLTAPEKLETLTAPEKLETLTAFEKLETLIASNFKILNCSRKN